MGGATTLLDVSAARQSQELFTISICGYSLPHLRAREVSYWGIFHANVHRQLLLSIVLALCAGNMDAAVQGWDINADNIEICRDANGEPWLLGEGSYGRVCFALTAETDPLRPSHSAAINPFCMTDFATC